MCPMKKMEYKLVPIASDLPELKILLPQDLIYDKYHDINMCLKSRGCSKDEKVVLGLKSELFQIAVMKI